MPLKIIGAGMAGLLAANMLRHHDPVVIESSATLPNNHNAVLRFRTSIVGDVLGINFKRVQMIKAPVPWKNPVADALAYSMKNGGPYRTDRSITKGLVTEERFIAPPDFVEQMARQVKIEFGKPFFFEPGEKVISTVPMPVLVEALDYPHLRREDFKYVDGTVVKGRIENCDAYCSLLVPDPGTLISRVSITGDELTVEIPNSDPMDVDFEVSGEVIDLVQEVTGIDWNSVHDVEVKQQRYAKIAPIDNDKRLNFIYWASTLQGRAFSLGRFATWRPGLLLDDLVNDVRRIDGWIKSKSPEYEQEQHHFERRRA